MSDSSGDRPAPSNTGPLNSIGPVHVLASGWDSLYLSFPGDLAQWAIDYLSDLKTAAAANGDGEPIEWPGGSGVVQGHSGGRFAFFVRSGGFDLRLSASSRLPGIYSQVFSALIHSRGVTEAALAVGSAALAFMEEPAPAVVSRADLYADFIGWIPEPGDLGKFVTRSRSRGEHYDAADDFFTGRRFTGFSFGRGDVVGRLYDKTRELKKSGKEWLWDLWGPASARQSVWRLEFQFRRKALFEFQIKSVEDLLGAEADLWSYGLDWLSLRIPTDNAQPYRWPIAPQWQELRSQRPATPLLGLLRRRLRQDAESAVLRALGGYLTSWGALHGLTDEAAASRHAAERLRQYYADQGRSFGEIANRKRERWLEL